MAKRKSIKEEYPELMKYWDYDKNNEKNFLPERVSCGSDKYFDFKCEKGHSFNRTIRKIRNKEQFCTVCYSTGIAVKFIINEYSKEKLNFFKQENNPNQTLSHIGTGSRENIIWTCPEGHDFKKVVGDFSKKTGTSCPKCRNLGIKQIYNNKKHSTVILGNLTGCKLLMNEFSKNNTIKPETIMLGNNRTKILWTCPLCNNDYKSSTSQRYRKQTGCPTCNNKRTQSRNEIRIFCELKILFNSVKENHIVEGYKYDVYIKDINLLIEYDGLKWHSYEKAKINDIKKNNIAKNNKLKLIRLRECGLEKITKNDIIIDMDTNINRGEKVQFHIIKLLLNYIEKSFGLNFNNYKDNFLKANKFINNKLYNRS